MFEIVLTEWKRKGSNLYLDIKGMFSGNFLLRLGSIPFQGAPARAKY